MSYQAPRWLPGGNLQTIFPATLIARLKVDYQRERWATPDGDFIDVDFIHGIPGKPFVVLFHGLESSSNSHYAKAMMAAISQLGWSGAVPHFRGCSGEINLAPRFYHSGDSTEVDWIVRRLRSRAEGKFYAVGESQHQADIVDAACAVSAPLDLTQAGRTLSKGFNRLYGYHFLQSLKPKCLLKLEQFPKLFVRERMLGARNLYQFDDIVTAPLHGYRSADDYWNRASSNHVLPNITVPTLLLNARNDPFLPGHYLPEVVNPALTIEYPATGGHVGFAQGPWPGNVSWLPQRLIRFLEGSTELVAV